MSNCFYIGVTSKPKKKERRNNNDSVKLKLLLKPTEKKTKEFNIPRHTQSTPTTLK